jgi:aspartyl-tRNA(Asn)/glutamyl-tRNA(Gln) amidotransferase subunit B
MADYGLSDYDAGQLTQSKAVAAYFEAAALASKQPKLVSNWVMGELSRRLNAENIAIESAPVTAEQLASLIIRIQDETISASGAKQAFDRLWANPDPRIKSFNAHGGFDFVLEILDQVITEDNLRQISDSSELEKIIDGVLAANAKNVGEIKAGNTKAMNALVGQAMKATQGKANPAQVNELLKKKIG